MKKCSAETSPGKSLLLWASVSARSGTHFRILFVLVCCIANNGAHCPSNCECKWKSGKESVICTNLNLTVVPRNLESSTQVLDLTGNLIRTITKHEFYNLNLINVQRMYLAKCRVKSIDRHAFYKLINLVELDLSYNLLTFVPSASFEFIAELRELRLSGNSIARLKSNAFLHVPQLVKLEMSACKITHIELTAFAGLENTLEVLKLNNNKLVNLNGSSITGLMNLNSLELSNNFWNCSCQLKPLRLWLSKQNIPLSIPPTCHFPQRLLHRPWDKLELEDLACKPRVRPLHATHIADEATNATLACETWGEPVPNVTWTHRGKVLVNSTDRAAINKRLYDFQLVYNISYLTVFSSDVSDAGEYVCTVENRAGKAQASVNLSVIKSVQTTDKYSLIQSKVFVHALFVILLVVLVVLFVFVYVLVFKNRVRLKAARAGARAQENYDKIELNHCAAKPVFPDCEDKARHPKLKQYVSLPNNPESRKALGSHEGNTAHLTYGSVSPPEAAAEELRRAEARQKSPAEKRDAAIRSYYEENFGEVTLQHHVLRKECLASGSLYTTSKQSSKTFPDLLESSPSGRPARRQSMFSTLPRMQSQSSQSSHSRSPLLPSSSQASSVDSNSSSRNHLMDLEVSNYHKRNFTSSNEMNSTTSLNLAPEMDGYSRSHIADNPSLPTSPNRYREPRLEPLTKRHSSLSETPILNILEPAQHNLNSASRFSMIASTTYDYHAAQLERFLEEYRTLQVELTKMKESCDSFVRSIDREERLAINSCEDIFDLHSTKPVSAFPADLDPGPKSILKNKSALSSLAHDSTYASEKNSFIQDGIRTESSSWGSETSRQYIKTLHRNDVGNIYYDS